MNFISIIAEYVMDGVIFITYEVQLHLVTEIIIKLENMNLFKQI